MTMSAAAPTSLPASERLLGRLVEDFAKRIETGEAPDVDAFVAAHPEHAEELRQLLPAIQVLAELGRSASKGEASVPPVLGGDELQEGALGDFRILREVGRGGMGVVYEAEQISLRRRVALKVLPFASTLDSRQLQRFKMEAQAAACLHHTNIVPVFATGVERGVHYYAMQFIEGHSLAEVIEGLKDNTHRRDAESAEKKEELNNKGTDETLKNQATVSLMSSLRSLRLRGESFFRTVAEFGIQAAEALEYAHQMGIVHRDIKPANLLLESSPLSPRGGDGPGVRGANCPRLWITDFGLAQFQTDTKLTMTGDVLGTLRYMSPEQALAQRAIVDHRTDIYSLGATLYELLTLQPAFDGKDRQEILRQIAFEEPKPMRRLRRDVPAELETIVLKAMEKEAEGRYGTAGMMADDLRRVLLHEPIRARRPGLVLRARKWARRHKSVVYTGVVLVFLALFALTALTLLVLQHNQELASKNRDLSAANTAEAKAKQEAKEQAAIATERERQARQLLYLSDFTAYGSGVGLGHAWVQQMLARHVPTGAQEDVRGFEWHLVAHQWAARRPALVLEGHTSDVRHLEYSPDGKLLASASWDGTVRLWDARTGQQKLWRGGHFVEVHAVAFSPDGKLLASGGADWTIRIWEVASGKLVRVFFTPGYHVNSVLFAKDGKTLFSGGGDKLVRRWNLETGQQLQPFTGHDDYVGALSLASSGDLLLSACGFGVVNVWDLQTGQKVMRFGPGSASCALHPDGQRALIAVHHAQLQVVDLRGNILSRLSKGSGPIVSIAVHPNRPQLIATGDSDGLVQLWDLGGRFQQVVGQHPRDVWCVRFSPDGTFLASASRDRKVCVWDLSTDASCQTISTPLHEFRGLASMGNGQHVVTGCRPGKVRRWDVTTGQVDGEWSLPSSGIRGAILAPNGRTLAYIGRNPPAIGLLELTTGQPRLLSKSAANRLAFSSDGRWLAASCYSKDDTTRAVKEVWVEILDLYSGKRDRLDGHQVVAFSTSGPILAMGRWTGGIVLYDCVTGGYPSPKIGDFWVENDGQLAFSPDGKLLVAARAWMGQLLDARTLEGVARCDQEANNGIECLAFTPDGKTLALGMSNGEVRLWNVPAARFLMSLQPHRTPVTGLAFVRDGRTLVTASALGDRELSEMAFYNTAE